MGREDSRTGKKNSGKGASIVLKRCRGKKFGRAMRKKGKVYVRRTVGVNKSGEVAPARRTNI